MKKIVGFPTLLSYHSRHIYHIFYLSNISNITLRNLHLKTSLCLKTQVEINTSVLKPKCIKNTQVYKSVNALDDFSRLALSCTGLS